MENNTQKQPSDSSGKLKIVEYKVEVSSFGEDRLMEMVSRSINRGWQPIGGVCMHLNHSDHEFAQAMVKYEEQ